MENKYNLNIPSSQINNLLIDLLLENIATTATFREFLYKELFAKNILDEPERSYKEFIKNHQEKIDEFKLNLMSIITLRYSV